MSWYWSLPLAISGAGAMMLAVMAAVVRRETGRLRVARVHTDQLRFRLRDRR